MTNILEVANNKPLEFLDALGFGGKMILIGMVSVFAVLGIIWAILTVFKMVFTNIDKNKKPTVSSEPVAQAPAVQAPTNDAEIVAVIAAAIAMAESECGNNVKFRVVSFKRK